MIISGGGSGHVIGDPISTPLEAIQTYLKNTSIKVDYADSSQIQQAGVLA